MNLRITEGDPILSHDGSEVLGRFAFTKDYGPGEHVTLMIRPRIWDGETAARTVTFYRQFSRGALTVWTVSETVDRSDLEDLGPFCVRVGR